ncbi:MAG: esterase family protein [Theionarchaea archaeon]|nr:MAG: hypothetical protein AYK18_04585 [Theionarchaea archaeon DG-70]MBU7011336.1 esterase family protein [Theionarchaea archaeon]
MNMRTSVKPPVRKFVMVLILLSSGCISTTAPAPDPEHPQNAPGLFYSYSVGDCYKIYVGLPKTYSEDHEYPTIYLLDGDWYFDGSHWRIDRGGVHGIVSRLAESGDIPEAIVVGIGYPKENQRGRDFLGSPVHFYRFLKEELIPFVDSTYSTQRDGRTLVGHSDGGFFTLYALLRYDPSDIVFSNFISISGDFSKVDRYLYTEEMSMYRRLQGELPVALYLAVGKEEEDRFCESNDKMAEKLTSRNYSGFRFKSIQYYGLHHGSVVAPAVEDGLKWIFLKSADASSG